MNYELMSLAPMPQVRIAFVGLGARGRMAVERWCNLQHVAIVAFCDVKDENVHAANEIAERYDRKVLATYSGERAYEAMCLRSDIDLVYVCTDWQSHTEIALCAMEYGKSVAIEVPAVLTVDDAWLLVRCAERKKLHCMMLENTLYDDLEMAVCEMIHSGLLGEMVHGEGGYAHCLGERWNTWRMEYNRTHKGDVYPTHGIGPICKAFDIHRTDSFDYLVSVDTASFSGKETYREIMGHGCEDFMNGDQTTTLIRTRRGRTITINHNVMYPRPYDRMFQIVGAHGYVAKYPVRQMYLD